MRRFRHSCVSDLDVDDEAISFTYTPPSMPGSPPLKTSVMIYTQNSPGETIVYLGSDERKFCNKMLHEIMDTLLKGLQCPLLFITWHTHTQLLTFTTPHHPIPPCKHTELERRGGRDVPSLSPQVRSPRSPQQFDPLFDPPLSGSGGDSGGGVRAVSPPPGVLGASAEFVMMEVAEDRCTLVDSRGRTFATCAELKGDIEEFWRVCGRGALQMMAFEEDLTLVLDIGVDQVIGRDTMMAWGFDTKRRVQVRMVMSTYYRDNITVPQVAVQEVAADAAPTEKFAPKFQLENIINRYIKETWSHGSKPFQSPVDTAAAASASSSSSSSSTSAAALTAAPAVRRVPESIAANVRALVDMGFDAKEAYQALLVTRNALEPAVNVCLECSGDLRKAAAANGELDALMAEIFSERPAGRAAAAGASSASATASARAPAAKESCGYLVGLVRYVQSRIPTLNEYCIICDQKHLLGHMLKPTVCSRELCCWSFQELGVAAGATDFVATSHEVVDMLLLFAKLAARSTRRDVIFDPFPLVFDPRDRRVRVLDPEHKDYARAEQMLAAIPTVQSLVDAHPTAPDVAAELNRISPFAYPLLTWVVSSNRSFFVHLPAEHAIGALDGEQYLMLSSPPDRERRFRELRRHHGSVYAFHGSSCENWHSIVRTGLRNASGTKFQVNGTAYGKGIYMSPLLSTASGYARPGGFSGSSASAGPNAVVVVAVCEVINCGINKATADIWTVAAEDHVTTRMLLLYKTRHIPTSPTGESVAPQIRTLMERYGVSQD